MVLIAARVSDEKRKTIRSQLIFCSIVNVFLLVLVWSHAGCPE